MMPENTFKIPKSQWKKMSPQARRVFNYLYDMMINNQSLFKHPKDVEQDLKMWKTTAWNAAWEASYAVDKV